MFAAPQPPRFAIGLFLAVLFIGCTTTVRRTRNPEFAIPLDSIGLRVARLVTSQHVNLDGEEITTNGKVSNELEIDIINGQHIPGDESQRKMLGQSIAAGIRNALKNRGQYDAYKVFFVKVDSGSVVTKRTWTEFDYEVKEL